METNTNSYKQNLQKKMDEFVHFVYKITKSFPAEELYGAASQFRRSALSIILNYIEGFARKRPAVQLNFLETSYGSFKEAKYLLYFSRKEGWIKEDTFKEGLEMAEEIGAMLWTEIQSLETALKYRKSKTKLF